jgi:cytidyltransferase-like protein
MSLVFFPGSFDPVHLGHLDVIEQASALFGEVVVATMHNPGKPGGAFPLAARQEMLVEATAARHAFVSSRFIREIAHYGGDVRHLVPAAVARRLGELVPLERS